MVRTRVRVRVTGMGTGRNEPSHGSMCTNCLFHLHCSELSFASGRGTMVHAPNLEAIRKGDIGLGYLHLSEPCLKLSEVSLSEFCCSWCQYKNIRMCRLTGSELKPVL